MNQRIHDAKFKAFQAINALSDACEILRQEKAIATHSVVVTLADIAVESIREWPIGDERIDVDRDLEC